MLSNFPSRDIKKILHAFLVLLVILFGSLARPKLHPFLIDLFSSVYIKFIFAFIICFTFGIEVSVALTLLAAVAVIYIVQYIYTSNFNFSMQKTETFRGENHNLHEQDIDAPHKFSPTNKPIHNDGVASGEQQTTSNPTFFDNLGGISNDDQPTGFFGSLESFDHQSAL